MYLRFSRAPVNCLPIARRMPAVTAPSPSNTWKRATIGRMYATEETTSVVQSYRSVSSIYGGFGPNLPASSLNK